MGRARSVLSSAAAVLLVAAAVRAEPARKEPPAGGGGKEPPAGGGGLFDVGGFGHSKEPITVTSASLEYDYKNNVVVYRGEVIATQGQIKVRSDIMTVTFEKTDDKAGGKTKGADGSSTEASAAAPPAPDPDKGDSPKLREVVATGSVRIDQGAGRWATGGKAVFDQTGRTLVLTENPVLHDGPNEVAGDRVIVYVDENRSVVEGGRKRVKAVLYPNKDETAAPAKPGPHAGEEAHEGATAEASKR